jgi:hypothetical protein
MLSVIYAECHIQALYAECLYVECHYAERHGAQKNPSKGKQYKTFYARK